MMGHRWGTFVLWGLVMLRLVMAWSLPLSPDEAYYWLWSHSLQWSYLDHPFMVALWIHGGTYLLGDTPLGIRFFGVLASLGASMAVYRAAKCCAPDHDQRCKDAAGLLNVTVMFGLGMIIMTPDTPLMFFIAVCLWMSAEALSTLSGRDALFWWCGVGVSLGSAGASKYTALLVALGLIAFVIRYQYWRHFGPWLGGAIAAGVVAPVLWWNAHHHWASFVKQGGRAHVWHPQHAGQFLGELLAGQVGLATPIVFLCCIVGLWHARRWGPFVWWCSIPAGGVFIFHACGDRVQANWPSVLYPMLALAGGLWGIRQKMAMMSGGALTALICFQAVWHPLALSAHWDPILRQTAGWSEWANDLRKSAQQHHVDTLLVDDYALASILVFHLHGQVSVIGADQRWSYLDHAPFRKVHRAFCVTESRTPSREGITIWRNTNKRPIRAYHVAICQGEGYLITP